MVHTLVTSNIHIWGCSCHRNIVEGGMLNPDLWHGQKKWHDVESKDLYLTWLCCSIRNGFDKPDYPYLSQNLTWGFRNGMLCNTPVLFYVTWLVVIFIYLKIIPFLLREALRKGVPLSGANLQFIVPDSMTYCERLFCLLSELAI